MPSYEQKLTAFAKDKRLLRLARPIRDRADAYCDACGSTLPRTLYALKDLASERHYFVGETCLKELAKYGAILRRYGRASGKAAYETEMKLRGQGAEEQETTSRADSAELPATVLDSEPADSDVQVAHTKSERPLFPAILILEKQDHYQVVVSILSAQGIMYSSGYAREARYEEVWSRGGEGGLMLEKVKEERLDASSLCLSKAWQQAVSHLEGLDMVSPFSNENGGGRQESELPYALRSLLRLDAMGFSDNNSSPNGRDTNPALPSLIAPGFST